jgi:hypothetical protein
VKVPMCFLAVVLEVVAGCQMSSQLASGAAPGDNAVQRAIAACMHHQEQLIRSMRCEYIVTVSPTLPEMIPLLRRLSGADDRLLNQYLCTPEMARRKSYSARWWRKGEKERLEQNAPDETAQPPGLVFAFDGNVVRSVQTEKGQSTASIAPLEKSHLRDTFRTEPFDLLYQCCGKPYSEIVGKGRDLTLSTTTVDGQRRIRLSVRHPIYDGIAFAFVFDAAYRVLERGLFDITTNKKRVQTQRAFFGKYKSFVDDRGETIWFPQEVLIKYFTFPLPDGTPIQYKSDTITFKSVAFNPEIPDDVFVVRLPENAKVYNNVTGQGWLPAIAGRSTWDNPLRPRRYTAQEVMKLVEKNPKGDIAVDALIWVVEQAGATPAGHKAVDLLVKDHMQSKRLADICTVLSFYFDSAAERYLETIMEKSPHKEVQGQACYALASALKTESEGEKSKDREKIRKRADQLFERVVDKYGAVKQGNSTLADKAKGDLFEIRSLAVGKVVPQIEGEDIGGKKFKLTDYRGKVVALDFWGNW